MKAPIHPRERERLAALRQYHILDTLPEVEYDDLAKLAAHICQTPIALISLVDQDRQWFKARYGIDAAETSRDVAFCAHAILENGALVVNDALKDTRFHDNDLVVEGPKIRFYAGAPLITPEGLPLGTLCVIDRAPRDPSPAQVEALEALSRQVISQLELRSKLRDMAELVTQVEQGQRQRQLLLEELQRSNRELEDFASVASHDLQEPLRKIQAFGDRLESVTRDKLDTPALDYLSRMRAAAARMQTLIADLLTFSRVTTKAQPFSKVALDQVVQGVLSDLELRIEETGGRVEVEPLPEIEADPTQMRQLFQNLIGNALKFHKPDEPPIVRVRCQAVEGPREAGATSSGSETAVRDEADHLTAYQFTIEDQGIGFDPTHADRIFEVFQRLHGRDAFEGTGVGLSVCRKIVQRHGGEIRAVGEADVGARFEFQLPVRRVALPSLDLAA